MNSEVFKSTLRKLDPIVYILLLGALLRSLAFLSLAPWDPVVVARYLLVTDQWSYNHIAISILNLSYGTESFWMPGWPAFIALVYSIFGEAPWVVLVFNIGLGTVGVFLLYKSVKLLLGDKLAVISSLLLACDPHQIIYSQTLLSENLFLPVLLIFFYFLVKHLDGKSTLYLILASLMAGSLVYIKSIALYIYIVPLVIIFFVGSGTIYEKLKKGVLIILVVMAVHFPMSLKNYVNDDYWAVTSNGGFNALFIYAGSVYTNQLGYSSVQKDQILQQKLDSLIGKGNTNQFDYDSAAKRLAGEIVLKYPLEFLTNHLAGCINIFTSLSTYQFSVVLGIEDNGLFLPGNYGASQLGMVEKFFKNKQTGVLILAGFIAIILLIQYFLASVGIFKLLRERRYSEFLIPFCFILYFALITGVIGSSARFRLPIAPFYLIFSGVGILYVKRWMILRKHNGNGEG